ncbi:MAG TPA: cytochrome c oxidase assembly factor Coa1 family protein [Pyrinomonadaceae bacterium]|jgi:glutamate/tyrosine decarboxylase-like PLP-dependent enzyme|nr:cytochrome c oxidase assembly factor Coa1 family protein [Pyrinomonadaceae bacterium]
MSTKKILLIIAGVVIVLGLIVALLAGGIVFFVFRTIGTSEAAETARTYLRNNAALKQEIGEVKDFGWLVTGNINVTNGDGVATLYLKAIGEKGEANTRVDLGYRNNREWRVTGASYTRDGKTVDLMQAYGPPTSNSP